MELRKIRSGLFAAVWLLGGWTAAVVAQTPPEPISFPQLRQGSNTELEVALNKSRVLDFARPVKILSVGNPEVADIVVVGSRQIYVVGKRLGNTNLVLWDRDRNIQASMNVAVTPDLEALKADLHEMLPTERVQVRSANGRLILSGEISSATRMDTALRLAQSFVPGDDDAPILNLMQVGGAQQVMLDVKVAEVSRQLVKRLETQFNIMNIAGSSLRLGAVKGGATFPDALFEGVTGDVRVPALPTNGTPVGPMIKEFLPNTPTIEDAGIFASYQRSDYLLNLVLDAANRDGIAKILAEPNLTTLTGQPAQFLAGGEVPVPVPQDNGQVGIEYKDFGVGLNFVPVVLDSGIINLSVDVSVSDLSNANAVVLGLAQSQTQFVVPSLVKRSASSTIELGNGQTIAIAGMLNESLRESVSKLPGFGDIPVLGALFRSQEFIKDQTELIIFVTPRLARPMHADQARLPTGSFVAPSDLEFYLLGRMQGRDAARPHSGAPVDPLFNRRDGGTEGRFGHDL